MPAARKFSRRNGSYLAYLRLEEHVGAFRDFLRQHGETSEQQELIAAKLMGRWRSGAPLVLAPKKDDPELGADIKRTNDFNYAIDGSIRLRMPAWFAYSSYEPARHGSEYESTKDDPARRYVRASLAGRRARGWSGAGNRCFCRMREPGAPVRVRNERMGKRSQLS